MREREIACIELFFRLEFFGSFFYEKKNNAQFIHELQHLYFFLLEKVFNASNQDECEIFPNP